MVLEEEHGIDLSGRSDNVIVQTFLCPSLLAERLSPCSLESVAHCHGGERDKGARWSVLKQGPCT